MLCIFMLNCCVRNGKGIMMKKYERDSKKLKEYCIRQQQNVQIGSRSCLYRFYGYVQVYMDMQVFSLELKLSIRRRKSRRRIMRRGIRKGGGIVQILLQVGMVGGMIWDVEWSIEGELGCIMVLIGVDEGSYVGVQQFSGMGQYCIVYYSRGKVQYSKVKYN